VESYRTTYGEVAIQESRQGKMTFWVGFDLGKTFHWVSLLDDAGEVVLSRRVEATEQGLEAACSQIAGLSEERKVALETSWAGLQRSCWRSSPSVASRSFTCRG
jgi:Transposase